MWPPISWHFVPLRTTKYSLLRELFHGSSLSISLSKLGDHYLNYKLKFTLWNSVVNLLCTSLHSLRKSMKNSTMDWVCFWFLGICSWTIPCTLSVDCGIAAVPFIDSQRALLLPEIRARYKTINYRVDDSWAWTGLPVTATRHFKTSLTANLYRSSGIKTYVTGRYILVYFNKQALAIT